MISTSDYKTIKDQVKAAGYSGEIEWARKVCAPENAYLFASEAIFVICNSGMKAQVARTIYANVMTALVGGRPVFQVFKHAHKAKSIETIWANRAKLYAAYMALETDTQRIEAIDDLPHIGGITKYHLAKNFGLNVAKPDRHLQRLADREGVSPQALCERLARESGDRVTVVDLVLWRACNLGLLKSREASGE